MILYAYILQVKYEIDSLEIVIAVAVTSIDDSRSSEGNKEG